MVKINPSEITPEQVYLSRRRFMKGVGALVASSFILAACGIQDPTKPPPTGEVVGATASPADSTSRPPRGPSPGPGVKSFLFNCSEDMSSSFQWVTWARCPRVSRSRRIPATPG